MVNELLPIGKAACGDRTTRKTRQQIDALPFLNFLLLSILWNSVVKNATTDNYILVSSASSAHFFGVVGTWGQYVITSFKGSNWEIAVSSGIDNSSVVFWERERETERRRDRETDGQRQRDWQTDREIRGERERERQRDRQIDRQTDTQRQGDRDRQTERQTDRQKINTQSLKGLWRFVS